MVTFPDLEQCEHFLHNMLVLITLGSVPCTRLFPVQ